VARSLYQPRFSIGRIDRTCELNMHSGNHIILFRE
jgi:hypothetical protein